VREAQSEKIHHEDTKDTKQREDENENDIFASLALLRDFVMNLRP
jgi:hypothetical protein